MIENPFAILETRLNRLENLLVEIKESSLSLTARPATDKWFDKAGLSSYLPGNPRLQTINTWIAQGKIPNHKQGKRILFLKSEIDNYLKQGRRKTAAELESQANSYLGSKNKKG